MTRWADCTDCRVLWVLNDRRRKCCPTCGKRLWVYHYGETVSLVNSGNYTVRTALKV